MNNDLAVLPASKDDAPMLAEIRAESMRPSLEAIKRFDPVRVRERFLSTFIDKDTFLLYHKSEIAGFYVLRDYIDHLYLDHFYIKAKFQGYGIGREVMKRIQQHATACEKPIRLIALKKSPANAFYLATGFIFQRAEDVDNYYCWFSTSATGSANG